MFRQKRTIRASGRTPKETIRIITSKNIGIAKRLGISGSVINGQSQRIVLLLDRRNVEDATTSHCATRTSSKNSFAITVNGSTGRAPASKRPPPLEPPWISHLKIQNKDDKTKQGGVGRWKDQRACLPLQCKTNKVAVRA